MKTILFMLLCLTQIYCVLFDNNPKSIEIINTVSYIPPIEDYSITNDIFNNQKVDKFKAKVQKDHFIQHKSKTTHPQLNSQRFVENRKKIQAKVNQADRQSVNEEIKGTWSLEQIKNTANDNLFLIIFIVGFFLALLLRSRKEPQNNVSIRLPDSEISMSATIMPSFISQS